MYIIITASPNRSY